MDIRFQFRHNVSQATCHIEHEVWKIILLAESRYMNAWYARQHEVIIVYATSQYLVFKVNTEPLEQV